MTVGGTLRERHWFKLVLTAGRKLERALDAILTSTPIRDGGISQTGEWTTTSLRQAGLTETLRLVHCWEWPTGDRHGIRLWSG